MGVNHHCHINVIKSAFIYKLLFAAEIFKFALVFKFFSKIKLNKLLGRHSHKGNVAV